MAYARTFQDGQHIARIAKNVNPQKGSIIVVTSNDDKRKWIKGAIGVVEYTQVSVNGMIYLIRFGHLDSTVRLSRTEFDVI